MSEENGGFDEALAFALWMRLMCQCDLCQEMLYLDSIDDLIDVNAIKWSEQAAREAGREGWRLEDDRILCALCASCEKSKPRQKA